MILSWIARKNWVIHSTNLYCSNVFDTFSPFLCPRGNRSGRSRQKSNVSDSLFFTSKSLFRSYTHKKRANPQLTDEWIPNPAFSCIKETIINGLLMLRNVQPTRAGILSLEFLEASSFIQTWSLADWEFVKPFFAEVLSYQTLSTKYSTDLECTRQLQAFKTL